MNRQISIPVTLWLLLGVLIDAPLRGASEPNVPEGTRDPNTAFKAKLDKFKQQAQGAVPAVAPGPGAVPATSMAYTCTPEMQAELGRALYTSYADNLAYNHSVFEWQLLSSRIIFWVILLLVFTGIAFSGLQFWKSFRLAGHPGNVAEMRTELEISARGFKVSSSVLGVIILITSLAFLYLYLVHVYPISYIQKAPMTPTSAESVDTEG